MSFTEARLQNQSVPKAWEVPVAAGEAFEVGALGTLVDGEFVEATSPDPDETEVTHVSQTPFGANSSGFGAIAGVREFPPGKAVVTEAQATTFMAEYLGDIPAAVGGLYGCEKDTDDKWKVNFDTVSGDLIVKYLGVPSDLPATPLKVEVEILAAAVTVAP
jgi:hypothetical protein